MSLTAGVGPLFEPPWLLRQAHVQSIVASLGLRRYLLRRRATTMLDSTVAEVLNLGGVRLLGYYTPHNAPAAGPDTAKSAKNRGSVASSAPGRGLLVILHGWEGSANSHYVVGLAAQAQALGFDVFRLNFRDHGGTSALNEGLFHSCRLEEVAAAVCLLARRCAKRPTYLVGFSLGGNFALRVAMHKEASQLLRKVVAVCPVLDPAQTMQAFEGGFWVYRYHFLSAFRRSLLAKAAAFPGLYDFGDLKRFTTVTSTTAYFVERYTAFPDLRSYLDGYSVTGNVLEGLTVPTWLLAAHDDPVVPSGALEGLARSDALKVTVTAHGGHCAYLEDLRLRSWLDQRILAALDDPPARF